MSFPAVVRSPICDSRDSHIISVDQSLASLCVDDAEYYQRVHRLLDALLCDPSNSHLDRVPIRHRRFGLRVRRDAGVVQQCHQPGLVRLFQRSSQDRSSRGLLSTTCPPSGKRPCRTMPIMPRPPYWAALGVALSVSLSVCMSVPCLRFSRSHRNF